MDGADLYAEPPEENLYDDESYFPVPPNRTFTVKTRYVPAGKGKPLPFREPDDE